MGALLLGTLIAALAIDALVKRYNERAQRNLEALIADGPEGRLSGQATAQKLLAMLGVDVKLTLTAPTLGDYYSHKQRLLNLSGSVASGCTSGAVAIAAHEVGHVVHWWHTRWFYELYKFLCGVSELLPLAASGCWPLAICNGSRFWIWGGLCCAGLILLADAVRFTCELIANRYAWQLLRKSRIEVDESRVREVFHTALMTYICRVAQSAALLILLAPLFWVIQ